MPVRTFSLAIAWCTAIAALCNASAADQLALPAMQLMSAEADFQRGRYASAYQTALACSFVDGKPHAGAVYLLALVCQRSGRLDEALNHGRQYLSLVDRPELRISHVVRSSQQELAKLLGDACLEHGRVSEAREWYQRALAIPGGKRDLKPAWQFEVRLAIASLPAGAPRPVADQLAKLRQCEDIARQIGPLLNPSTTTGRKASNRVELTSVLAEALAAAGKHQEARRWLESLLQSQMAPAERVATLVKLADVARRESNVAEQARQLELAIALQRQAKGDDARLELTRLEGQLASALDRAAILQPTRATQLREQARKHRQQVVRLCDELRMVFRSRPSDPIRQLTFQQHLVEAARDSSDWQNARALAEELLHLRVQTLLPDDPSIYRTMTALGTFSAKSRDFVQAREHLLKAASYWRQRELRSDQDLGDALQNLAEVAREQGDYAESRDYFQQALQAFDRAGENLVQRLESRVGLANVLSAEGRYQQAIEQFADAEQLARGATDDADDDTRRLLSRALLGRAIVYRMHLAQLHLAIEDCEEALSLFRGTIPEDPLEEVPYLATRATLYLAQYEAAGCPAASADLQQARQSIERAHRLTSSRGDETSAERCQVLHVLGVIRLREAQAHFREGGDRNTQAAATACNEAFDLWRQAEKIGTLAGQARSLCYLAEAHLLAFDQSLPISAQSPDVILNEALTLASKAAERLEEIQVYPGLYYRALLVRAKILRRQARQLRGAHQDATATEKMRLAIADLMIATRQVETPRFASLGSDADRAEFFSQFVEAYELLVACLAQVGRFEEALAFSQISRNRTFIEQVLISEGDLRAELEPLGKAGLLDELAKVAQTRDRLKSELQRALDRSDQQQSLARLRQDLANSQRQYDRISSEIRRQSTSYRNLLDGGLSPDDWIQARKQILRRNEAMLVYHLGDSGSYLFVVKPDAQAPVEAYPLWITAEVSQTLGVPQGSLNNATARGLVQHYLWRRGTAGARGSAASQVTPPQPFTTDQALVFSELILPAQVRDELLQCKPSVVVVVPDGPLHELPLESLVLRVDAGQTVYVLDDETLPPLSYAPSAMVLAALEARAQRMPEPPRLLTVGNPQNALMQPLTMAAAECDAWRQRLTGTDGRNVTTLLGTQATAANVLSQVERQNVLHFAVHGLVDRRFDDVFAASLLLTPEADGRDRLYLQDVYRMRLGDCRLAVLSACQSNVGAARKLEAGATLTRAFLSAGAERVVSSLWQVDDEATLALMRAFAEAVGRSLQRGEPPNYAHALQQARRHVKQSAGKSWQDPYYWAPFVLVGPAE